MSNSRLTAIAILLGLVLTGCEKKPPEAPPSLPRVERPVQALNLTILSGTKLDARSAPAGGAPGMAHIKPGATLRITIPRAALVERGGIPGVFALSEAGEARFRLVRPGRTSGTQVEILSGLHGNETLVLGDLAAVHDGSPIIVLNADKRR